MEALLIGPFCRTLDIVQGRLKFCRVPCDNDNVGSLARKDTCRTESGSLGSTCEEDSLVISESVLSPLTASFSTHAYFLPDLLRACGSDQTSPFR